jgi:hypothetical protein
MSATPIICGMGFFTFRQPTVAACWRGRLISFLGVLLVLATASVPRAAGRLLAICPDVAELLAVVALDKSILGCISLHPDINVTEARQTKNVL